MPTTTVNATHITASTINLRRRPTGGVVGGAVTPGAVMATTQSKHPIETSV
jgi:hypothetical protein